MECLHRNMLGSMIKLESVGSSPYTPVDDKQLWFVEQVYSMRAALL